MIKWTGWNLLGFMVLGLNVEQTYKADSILQNKLRTFIENIFDKKFCSLNFISLFRDMILTITDFHQITGISRNTVYSWIDRGNLPKGITVAGIGKSKILDVTEEYEHFKTINKVMKKYSKV
jgi:Helix-turn-helix domain